LGFSVTPVSLEGLIELTDARREVEGLVFRRSVREGTLDWESEVVAAHHVLQRTPARLDGHFNQAWSVAHIGFHNALLAGCTNRRLLSLALSLRDAAEVYRRAWQRPVGDNALRDVASEHQRLMDIAVSRDEELAYEAIGAHIQATTDYMVQHSAEVLGVS
jgi:DNA-binding GntR family transcriptional regulator